MRSADQQLIQAELERLQREIGPNVFGEIGVTFVVRNGEITRVNRHDTRTVQAPGSGRRS